jgi:hypothetical protein
MAIDRLDRWLDGWIAFWVVAALCCAILLLGIILRLTRG